MTTKPTVESVEVNNGIFYKSVIYGISVIFSNGQKLIITATELEHLLKTSTHYGDEFRVTHSDLLKVGREQ